MGIITQVAAGELLRGEHDLPRMPGEVFDNVIDRLEYGQFVFLDLPDFEQALRLHGTDDGDRFRSDNRGD